MALTSNEQNIVKAVVERFVHAKEPTSKNWLAREFREPAAVDRLCRGNFIRTTDNFYEEFLPTALSFQYCNNPGMLNMAKSGIEQVLKLLFKLYYANDSKRTYTSNEIEEETKGHPDFHLDKDTLSIALYLIPEFVVLRGYSYNEQHTALKSFQISDEIVTYDEQKIGRAWSEHIKRIDPNTYIGLPLQNAWEQLNGIIQPDGSRKVFLVHGHNHELRVAVAELLQRLDLDPVILDEQANKSRTIIEKFEDHSENVSYAVVLLTPDDVGGLSSDDLQKRARQNVILELGYFIGKLGRARVCALYAAGVEIPSDIHGVLYVAFDQEGRWRLHLAKEIQAAGLAVDLSRASGPPLSMSQVTDTKATDARIYQALGQGISLWGKDGPFTGAGDRAVRTEEIAAKLALAEDVVADSLERLEAKGRVTREDGTLDNPAPYWLIRRR